jgi:hypothetical protein
MKDDRNSLPLFREVQTFSRWWLLVGVLPPIIPLIFILSDHSDKNFLFPMLLVIIISAIVPFLLLIGSLTVELRPDSISFRLPPFALRWRSISKDDIAKIYIRKYEPVGEFGGWGVRWGMSGGRKDRCYSTRGNMGIQIELKDGNKILIGTQKPNEWQSIIKETLADLSV